MRLQITRAALLIAATALASKSAFSAEIRVLSANGMREVMQDLGPKFEAVSGHRLSVAFATVGVIVKRIQDGETADVIVIPRQGIDRLVQDNKASAESVVALASSGIGLAVRKGAPKPDISTPEALKRTLLAAKSVTYLDPSAGGTTGAHFISVVDRLGIADAIKTKTVFHPNARAAATLVANGEAEIGVNLVQELMPLPGIEIVGPLPDDLQLKLVFAATIMNGSKEVAASKILMEFLRTPDAAVVIRAKGMAPP